MLFKTVSVIVLANFVYGDYSFIEQSRYLAPMYQGDYADNNGAPSVLENPGRPSLCLYQGEYGDCNYHALRYYYDINEKTCKLFVYSGCGGNSNNFKTKVQCAMSCGAQNFPEIPQPISGYQPSWPGSNDFIFQGTNYRRGIQETDNRNNGLKNNNINKLVMT